MTASRAETLSGAFRPRAPVVSNPASFSRRIYRHRFFRRRVCAGDQFVKLSRFHSICVKHKSTNANSICLKHKYAFFTHVFAHTCYQPCANMTWSLLSFSNPAKSSIRFYGSRAWLVGKRRLLLKSQIVPVPRCKAWLSRRIARQSLPLRQSGYRQALHT